MLVAYIAANLLAGCAVNKTDGGTPRREPGLVTNTILNTTPPGVESSWRRCGPEPRVPAKSARTNRPRASNTSIRTRSARERANSSVALGLHGLG